MATTWSMDIFWIVSSLPTCGWLLILPYAWYSSTYSSMGILYFLSQRLKCEATGRSAIAPELDDKGSSRGAAYRCTHIGRGHNATTRSFLSAIVKAVLAV